MGLTIGAMLEEIQALYKQHHQSCFLYLSSEVIKVYAFLHGLQAVSICPDFVGFRDADIWD